MKDDDCVIDVSWLFPYSNQQSFKKFRENVRETLDRRNLQYVVVSYSSIDVYGRKNIKKSIAVSLDTIKYLVLLHDKHNTGI